MEHVDFSQPLAALIRAGTHEIHETISNSPAVATLLSGQLSRDDYIRYLMMLWHIYQSVTLFPSFRTGCSTLSSTLEDALDKHATHPVLEPTYNPPLLRRAPALADDISHLLQVPLATWQSHPAHLRLQSTLPAPLVAYLVRIRTLTDSADPAPLLAHSYVRYVGDLSGGQIIRRMASKAYGLDETDRIGLKFYEFRELMGSGIADQGEMKRIKEWFKDGMDTAGDIGVEVKGKCFRQWPAGLLVWALNLNLTLCYPAAVYEETTLAYDLNSKLFNTIQTVGSSSTPQSKESDDALTEQTRSQTHRFSSVAQFLPLIIAGMSV